MSVAALTARAASTCACWSKFTIRRYQKTRRLLNRADQLRSSMLAIAAAPSSGAGSSEAAISSGSSRSHELVVGSQSSAQAWASELRIT